MVHFIGHIVASAIIAKALSFDSEQFKMFVGANLLDIDHLFDGEICDNSEKGSTFDNNFFHQIWPVTLATGTIINPYLGSGLAFHYYLDYLDTKNPTNIPCDERPTIPSIGYVLKQIGL